MTDEVLGSSTLEWQDCATVKRSPDAGRRPTRRNAWREVIALSALSIAASGTSFAIDLDQVASADVTRPSFESSADGAREGALAKIDARLDHLAALVKGWYDGQGEPLSLEVVSRARALSRALLDANVPPPYIYPTVDGRITLEWSFGRWEVEAEIDTGAQVALMSVNVDNHEYDEETAGSKNEAFSVVRFVTRYMNRDIG